MPVTTPSRINNFNPLVFTAFADGVAALSDSPMALDVPMGEIPIFRVHSQPLPVFGGEGFAGVLVVASERPGNPDDGRYRIRFGNSSIRFQGCDNHAAKGKR
ncbi:MAG: hypothetical protein R3296_00955 [Oleiphilaceae bacterium]|nr:hypothetical protein [Oleiphilaceae bacterium]